MRHHCRRLVVGVPSRRIEGVICIGIGIYLNVSAVRESVRDLVACLCRHKLVKLCEVHHHRTSDLVFEAKIFFNSNTVVTDCRIDLTMGGSKVTEFSAKTESNCTDFALARVLGMQG